MRASRALFAPLCASLVVVAAPEAPATANRAKAETYSAYRPEGGFARVAAVCTGLGLNGNLPVAVRTRITCDIFDSSGVAAKQFRATREFSGPACVCVVHAHSLVPPVKVCSTVEAQFSDFSWQYDRHCVVYGNFGNETQPQQRSPGLLDCLEPIGLERSLMETAIPVLEAVEDLLPN